MNNHPFFIALFGIYLNHVNVNGKCLDAVVCKEIAEFIHGAKVRGYGGILFDFIYEYGEDEDSTMIGRDEYGEKQYHSFNPDTNWHKRIGVELGKLGHYNQGEEVVATFTDIMEYGMVAA